MRKLDVLKKLATTNIQQATLEVAEYFGHLWTEEVDDETLRDGLPTKSLQVLGLVVEAAARLDDRKRLDHLPPATQYFPLGIETHLSLAHATQSGDLILVWNEKGRMALHVKQGVIRWLRARWGRCKSATNEPVLEESGFAALFAEDIVEGLAPGDPLKSKSIQEAIAATEQVFGAWREELAQMEYISNVYLKGVLRGLSYAGANIRGAFAPRPTPSWFAWHRSWAKAWVDGAPPRCGLLPGEARALDRMAAEEEKALRVTAKALEDLGYKVKSAE